MPRNFWESLEADGWHVGFRHNPEHFSGFWLEPVGDRVFVRGRSRRRRHGSRIVAVLKRRQED